MKLQTKYILLILSVIFFTLAIITSAVLVQFKSTQLNTTTSSSEIMKGKLLTQFEERAELTTLFLSEELINPVYQYDMEAIYKICKAARQQKDVVYVYVYDPAGRIIHDGTGSNPNLDKTFEDTVSKNAVKARKLIFQITEDVLDAATPIKFQNEVIGGVRVGLSLTGIRGEIREMRDELTSISQRGTQKTLFFVILIAALLLVCALVFGAFLARNLSRPINLLSKISAQVGRGEYDIDIPVKRSDEIGELLRSFKKMSIDLQKTTVSRAYLDNIISSMINTLIVFDTNYKITTVNKATCELLGYEKDEVIGSDISLAIKKEEVLGNMGYDEFIEKGSIHNYETTYYTKSGVQIPVFLSSSVILDRTGKVEGILAIASDITKIKEVEEELQESERRYRSVFENTGTATVIIEEDTTISMANAEFEKLSGYSREEIEGKMSWTEFVVREDLKAMKEHHVTRRKDGEKAPIGYEFRFVDRQGNIKDILNNVNIIIGTQKSVASLLDITARKQDEQERIRLATAIEQASETIVITDIEGRIQYVNPAFERITGYTREEALGQNPRILKSGEHGEEFYTRLWDKISHGDVWAGHFVNKKKDGTVYEEEAAISPVLDNSGKIINYVAVKRDITDQKRLERQLQQVQRLKAIGTLAGGIAHDFNNLLMGIQGNASLMLLNKDSGHRDYEKLKNIEQYVQNGAELTKQLLGFARGGKYEVKPADINELVRKSSEMFGRTKKEINIHQKYQENVWTMEVDKGQIDQVLLNLYVNAWQAMPGGGDLYVQTENITLDENYVKPFNIPHGRYVKISVTDTGLGMEEEIRQRIFDPFFTTKEMGRGTGLGLASAYGIIKNHGGIINVYSEKGEGTTFNIYL
ncbi:MAG: PAS domain S-box protein, partial [Thermodesulfobacteriota bacterium]|nr:PAS domain S-box protein [Thermodesulfobacteriota bacterium]